MQTMAQQVLVYRLSGTAASLGIISFIGLIPVIPLSLWSGSISDLFSKRTIILAMQWTMLVQALILAYLSWTGTISNIRKTSFKHTALLKMDLNIS